MTDTLHVRVRGEYREMPGLRLTLAQAARLFNLNRADCQRVLQTLVTDGALWTNGLEHFGTGSSPRVT
jgi:DNA-binding IclR family transcriptional regulator